MIEVNVHEAKTHLSRLLLQAESGEEVVIARSGEPVARLVAIAKRGKKRLLGQYKGEVVIAGDFDEPVDPETFA
jgi:prevent-host-death family protein